MNYSLHPDAALEHEEQVAYYEAQAVGLGRRYHAVFMSVIAHICEMPRRFRVIAEPEVRVAAVQGFPHSIFFRQTGSSIQVLAVAHHRKRPGYWLSRR